MPAYRLPKNRACPLCSSSTASCLSHLSFPLFEETPIAGEVDLLTCENCGFLYYDTPSTVDDFDTFYRDHYLVHSYNLRDNHPAESAYLADTIRIIRQSGLSPDALVVDVGCGPGHLLRRLKEAGFHNLMGIELFSEYVEKLIVSGIQASVGSATELRIGGAAQADCLIYKNIFEHFLDFDSVLDQIEQCLSPQGIVVVEIPDASWYGKFQDYQPLSYFTLEHVNHFDPWHLEWMFSRRGFELIQSGTRLLDIAERYPIPIQYGIFRRGQPASTDSGAFKRSPFNFDLTKQARSWLSDPARFTSSALDALYEKEVPVHVWGLSYRTMAWLGMSTLKDCHIVGFHDIDPRKQGRRLLGQQVTSPDNLKNASASEAVVIGVGPSSQSMRKLLEKWEFPGEIVVLD